MNNGNFKSSLSSKLEFRLEYCWLPVPDRSENFTGLLNCIICRTLTTAISFYCSNITFLYYMALSHKDWELPNSRI